MGDRRVDEQQPQARKQQHGGEPHSLGERADDQRGRDDRERHLEHDENRFRNVRQYRAWRIETDIRELGERETPNQTTHRAFTESQAIAANDPQNRHDAGDGDDETLHEHGERITPPYQAA